jgi:hypothetical protein
MKLVKWQTKKEKSLDRISNGRIKLPHYKIIFHIEENNI